MKRVALLSVVLCAVLSQAARAQNVLDDVFLLRSTEQDARVASAPWLDGRLFHNVFETSSYSYLGVRAGLPISPKLETALGLDYFRSSSDFTDGTSGLTDLFVYGKYNFSRQATRLSTGAFVTVPIGSEEIGEGDVDVGIFVAARHPLNERTAVTGKVSLDYFRIADDDSDPSFRFHGGLIRRVSERVAVLGEVLVSTAVTTAELSAGVDYGLTQAGRLRGAVGMGLNDKSSDLSFIVSYIHSLGRRVD